MSSIKNIIILLLALTSASCAISKKENERFDSLNGGQAVSANGLTKDSVSHENLTLFENRAIQKLIDFYDYLNILGHDNFNAAIMEEVRSSARKLFYNPGISIDPYIIRHQSMPSNSIQNLLIENHGDKALPEIEILNVEITQALQQNDQGFYSGKLSFDIKSRTDAVIVTKRGAFSLRKIDKKFGEETIRVWEVFLDHIL